MADDKMVRLHHWLNGHEFEQTLGDSEGQGSLACYSPWSHKDSDITSWLNKNKYFIQIFFFWPVPLFSFTIPSWTPYYIQLSWILIRYFVEWPLRDICLIFQRLELWVCGKKARGKVTVSSQHIKDILWFWHLKT